ncbi:amino acid ABC transporter substrate-binding protein [Thermopetrobacter sp. TC1]|uniref:amino acid ABC transporter substrate-binding protein n=1 Tax=Thermopetrobacter sp. TC1 TaxID=1495045 RepID=UPI00057190DE|nr:amino acid ABC transporter substrate-binding protein [Thermopetrobacter sp. TC1]
MKRTLLGIALGAAVSVAAIASATAGTLQDVKAKGFVQCGVSQGLPGFSNPDEKGNWKGLDVDLCRAIAAAVFGDASKVKFTPLSAKERFTALQSGEVDVLSRNTTWTMQRDTALGLNFAGVNYYDGQGFMVRKSLGVTSAMQLNGAAVCTNTGTTTELNLADFFRSHKMQYEVVAFEKADEVVKAYDEGRCDVYTTDRSGLAAQRLKLKNPDEHIILPETISKEPLGPVVRQGDDQWFDLVKWTLFAMINAEELGVTSKNVDEMKKSNNPAIKRLLGIEGKFGENIGVSNDWAYNIIKQVGNYGESYDRNVGPKTPLGLSRGLNALWNKGGIMYAPPIR